MLLSSQKETFVSLLNLFFLTAVRAKGKEKRTKSISTKKLLYQQRKEASTQKLIDQGLTGCD